MPSDRHPFAVTVDAAHDFVVDPDVLYERTAARSHVLRGQGEDADDDDLFDDAAYL